MSEDPWELLDEVLVTPGNDGDRIGGLQKVLALSATTDIGTLADRAELASAVKSMLASLSAVDLDEARRSVADAARLSRFGWPNYHLAEAEHKLGHPEDALASLEKIPDDFFQSRDLMWRRLRCMEMEALSRIALGQWEKVEELVGEMATHYAAEAYDELYESPRELVAALLANPAHGRPALRILARAIDTQLWLGAATATRIALLIGNESP